jgi:hypothetical protein
MDSLSTFQVGQRVLAKLSDPGIRRALAIPDSAPLAVPCVVVAPPQSVKLPAGVEAWFYGVLAIGRPRPSQIGICSTDGDYFLAHEGDMCPDGPAPAPMLAEPGALEALGYIWQPYATVDQFESALRELWHYALKHDRVTQYTQATRTLRPHVQQDSDGRWHVSPDKRQHFVNTMRDALYE